jgi:hypothetical protein
MNSPFKKILRYKTLLFVALVVIAIIILVFFIYKGDPAQFKNEIIISILSTLVTILVLEVGLQLLTNAEFEQTVEKKIVESLSGDKNIIEKYRDENIHRLIGNSFSTLLGDFLSDRFMKNVVDRQLRNASYRNDYSYNVTIEAADCNNYQIYQDLSYRKCIKRRGRKAPVSARFFFSFEGDPFAAYNHDNSIVFFREELTERAFINRLREATTNEERIELLEFGFSIEVGGVMTPVPSSEITTSIVNNKGLIIEVPIKKEHISENEREDTYEYMASMECHYPAGRQNHFYCAFPEPTLNAKFSIVFHGIDLAKVDQVTFISSDNYYVRNFKPQHKKELERRDPKQESVIFPHSGIVFFWNDNCDNEA